ncbi:MAG: hypothetical protein EOP61_23935 [Sphingomonadales bacterium]|nr:MAG: hypothetical protein EOP61_23935 [Sphingomonadales bacterium]
MKTIASLALAFALTSIAHAQAPVSGQPVAGQTVDAFEMAPDRTVIFEPQSDGRIKIITVTDKNRHAPMPRNPGQVAVAMTFAREIGAVIEFNSGLDYDFTYQATTGNTAIPSCPVRGDAVASDQWPQGYQLITIGKLTRTTDTRACGEG